MIRINLLPTKAERKKETVIFQLIVGVVVLVITAGFCLVINRSIDQKIDSERLQVADIQNRIKQLESIIRQVEDFKQKQKDLNQKNNENDILLKEINEKNKNYKIMENEWKLEKQNLKLKLDEFQHNLKIKDDCIEKLQVCVCLFFAFIKFCS